jgi:N-acetylglucosamine malate deacetylase 2
MTLNLFLKFSRLKKPLGSRYTVLVVTAHPDDEVIGLGAQLPRLDDLHILHVTDGAPRNMVDARANGFETREEYARARRRELEAALELCGIPPERLWQAGIVDQEASFRLGDLIGITADVIGQVRPDLIFCHAYEGGHPDHDASAFAVHAALYQLRRKRGPEAVLMEFALYHAAPDGMAVFRFLPRDECPWILLPLTLEESVLKRQMKACFKTQRRVLAAFPVSVEIFRIAPIYDFTIPPHSGRLYYENFEWGVDGETWRALVSEELHKLRLPAAI